eukprot:3020825-Ditylum_brightwellii.AAC.1
MFGSNADSHTTDCCSKKNLLSSFLDGHKKKCMDEAKKEEFCAMEKVFKKGPLKSKIACKMAIHDLLELETYLNKE